MRDVGHTGEHAFNLATVLGARATKRGDKLGSIAVGKVAGLVFFNKNSASMVCATAQNPVAAIILHSSPADVDTVIVSRVVRKSRGALMPIELNSHGKKVPGLDRLEWKDIACAHLASKAAFDVRIQALDMVKEVQNAKRLYLSHPTRSWWMLNESGQVSVNADNSPLNDLSSVGVLAGCSASWPHARPCIQVGVSFARNFVFSEPAPYPPRLGTGFIRTEVTI